MTEAERQEHLAAIRAKIWAPANDSRSITDDESGQHIEERFRRVVVTKRRIYDLESDQTGTPAVGVFGVEMAERLGIADATVYDMPDGRRIIPRPKQADAP